MSQESNNSLVNAVLENAGFLRFMLLAGFLFSSFFVVYNGYLYDSDPFLIYLELCASSTSRLINYVLSMHTLVVEAVNDVYTKILAFEGSESYVIVARGCDASMVFAVLISTVGAWPGKWYVKLPVIMLGLLVMFFLNILRIAGMLLVDLHLPDHFDLFHEWILPMVLIMGALAYFYVWITLSGTHPSDD